MDGTIPEKNPGRTHVHLVSSAGTTIGSRLMTKLLEQGIDVKPLEDIIDEGGLTNGMGSLTTEQIVRNAAFGALPAFCLPSIGRGLIRGTMMFSEAALIPIIVLGYTKIKKGPGKGRYRACRLH